MRCITPWQIVNENVKALEFASVAQTVGTSTIIVVQNKTAPFTADPQT